jgi:hypothetical protein
MDAYVYVGPLFTAIAWAWGVMTARAEAGQSHNGIPHPYLFAPAAITLFAAHFLLTGRPIVGILMLSSIVPWMFAVLFHGNPGDGSAETLAANHWWDGLTPGQQRRLYKEAVDRQDTLPTR